MDSAASTSPSSLLAAITQWLQNEPSVKSAVLFGSAARATGDFGQSGTWTDFDLHVATTAAERIEKMDWSRALPGQELCLKVGKSATGGVRKVALLFKSGEIEMVLVPVGQLKLVRFALNSGLYRRVRVMTLALNEISTCVRTGYRFLKGEREWGEFYRRVATEMAGVRVSNAEAVSLADLSLREMLWLLGKLETGELLAAQYILHRQLSETNFRLLRELRLRRGQPLPSFALGRRVEQLLPPDELALVRIDARPEKEDLRRATWQAFDGLVAFMRELVPEWSVSPGMRELLEQAGDRPLA